MFKVINPIFLYLLFVAFFIFCIYIYGEFKRDRQLKSFGSIKILSSLMPSRSLARQRIKFTLVLAAFIASLLLCARLQYASQIVGKRDNNNVEVVAVVDVSNSMKCTDVQPSRLDMAKQILNLFFDQNKCSRFGLVEFAGLPVTRLPLTKDFSSSKMFVNSLSPEDLTTQGTAIGAALRQAQKSFSKQDGIARSILLITDAENHEDDALETAKAIFEKSNIQINVVGLGSFEGATIQLSKDSVLLDPDGKIVTSRLDEKLAKSIASATKGVYVHSNNCQDIVDAICSQLDETAKESTTSSQISSAFADQFEFFAWIAFILLVLDGFLMERKNQFVSKLYHKLEIKKSFK